MDDKKWLFIDAGEWVRGLRPVRWIRWKFYHLRRRAKVRRNWERYEELAEHFYSPWFDASEGGYMLYMSNPDNLRCMFCGCHYVRFDNDDWTKNESERQNHSENCLWHKIEQLQQL